MELHRDLFICPVCTDEYKDPRLLQCGHSFCLVCLEQWANQRQNNNKQIVCPTCKGITIFRMNTTGPDKLPRDFKVNQIKEVFAGVNVKKGTLRQTSIKKCNFCSGKEASRFCAICDKFLCAECNSRHRKNSLFRDHCTESLQNEMEMHLLCGIHKDETIKYFCCTCKKVMCSICAMDNEHETHSKTSLAEGLKQCRNSLDSLLEPLAKQYKANEAILADVNIAQAEMNKNLIRSKELVERITDEMVAQVQEWEMKIQKELELGYENGQKQWEEYVSCLNISQKQIQDVQNTVSSLGQTQNTACQVVTNIDEITSKVSMLTSKSPEPLTLKVSSFQYPKELTHLTDYLNSNMKVKEKLISVDIYEDVTIPRKPRYESLKLSDRPQIPSQPNRAKLLWSIDKRSSQIGEVLSPISVAFSPSDDIILSEVDCGRVQIFDKFGVSVGVIKCKSPKGAVADAQGNIYIVDSESGEVITYNSNRKEIKRWGKDILFSPRSISLIPGTENIVVVDRKALKITVHTKDGEVLHTSGEQARLKCPISLCVNFKGQIIIADRDLDQINIYTHTCQFLFSIPINNESIERNPTAVNVIGVAVDQGNYIYVCLHEDKKVVKYAPNGDLVGIVLSADDNIKWATGIAINDKGYIAVVESKVPKKHSALKLYKLE